MGVKMPKIESGKPTPCDHLIGIYPEFSEIEWVSESSGNNEKESIKYHFKFCPDCGAKLTQDD